MSKTASLFSLWSLSKSKCFLSSSPWKSIVCLNNTSNAHRPLPLLPLSLSQKNTYHLLFSPLQKNRLLTSFSACRFFSLPHTHIEKRKENINQIKIKKNPFLPLLNGFLGHESPAKSEVTHFIVPLPLLEKTFIYSHFSSLFSSAFDTLFYCLLR